MGDPYADIVSELRHKAELWAAFDKPVLARTMARAADEIERLRAALTEIADKHPYPGMGEELQTVAREALGENHD